MNDQYASRRWPSYQDGEVKGTLWPARAQRLLETSYARCTEGLQEPLRRCVAEFEEQLFALADHARNSTVQQDCFASRQRVLHGGKSFTKQFMEQLGAAFDQVGQEEPESDATTGRGIPWQSLELVDPGEQEISMLIEQLGSRGEVRHSNVLCELGYRLGALVGAPPLEGRALPIGPHAMAKACNAASGELGLPLEHQLLLLKQFDLCAIQASGPLYESVNDQLKADGIMPQLLANPIPRQSGRRTHSTNANIDDGSDATAPTSAANVGKDKATHPPEGTSDEPIEVLESLRNLLVQQRTAQGGRRSGVAGRAASEDELQSALGALQQHLAQVTDQASRELHSAARLREELLAQLNVGKPASAPRTQLSDEQGDTVELVARLFEQLGQQLQRGGNASTVLSGLQLPVLRMAVADHGFFDEREHPARRLLDTVTAAANEWMDGNDDEGNRPLADKLEQLVSRANQEPPSAGLYTTLLADIEHHLALLTRKAQAAERRHVEAAQGRERLDQARRRAGELMAERFAKSSPRGLLRALLDRAWSDVLALTLLRHGEESDTFRAQLEITDQLLGLLPFHDRLQLQSEVESGLQQIGMHAEEAEQVAQRLLGTVDSDHSVETPSATDLAIRLKQHQRFGAQQSSEEVTASVSTTAQTAAAVATTAATASASASAPAPAPTINDKVSASTPAAIHAPATAATTSVPREKSAARESRPAHTVTPTLAAAAVARAPKSAAVDSRLQQIEQSLKESPFGSWFEFIDPTTGQITRRKLAWYSLMSGRCLLVSRRGQPGKEMTLAQLAHEMAAGHAREAPVLPDSLLDRAWRSLTGSLQVRRPALPEAISP